MNAPLTIHWFRQDLRLTDNPALRAAANHNSTVLPVYIWDNSQTGPWQIGAAGRCWLHHSLQALNDSLQGHLNLFIGDPLKILSQLCQTYTITAIYWNRCYEPWRIQRDSQIKQALRQQGIEVHSFNAALLWEPWQIAKDDGAPYRVFTPFYRKGYAQANPPRRPLPPPSPLSLLRDKTQAVDLNALALLPPINWHQTLCAYWSIGEAAAQNQLDTFINHGLNGYKDGRNYPAKPHVSRLSPHLHFGEISPHQLWYAAQSAPPNDDIDHFCSELGWREFSYYLLYHRPDLPECNLQSKFDAFPWRQDETALQRWQQGKTGIPIIDAGMRELWQTGYMHNRVRMITASFLVKNLLLDWRLGERWFWDCLVDADVANNSASWQWVAGCGADAAPYFRIFNPVTQAQKFDPDGHYIRQYVPEIAALPDHALFAPWQASATDLSQAKVRLGIDYPRPMVDLKISRQRALDAFATLRQ